MHSVYTCREKKEVENNYKSSVAMFTCYVRVVGIVPKFDWYSEGKTET